MRSSNSHKRYYYCTQVENVNRHASGDVYRVQSGTKQLRLRHEDRRAHEQLWFSRLIQKSMFELNKITRNTLFWATLQNYFRACVLQIPNKSLLQHMNQISSTKA